MKINDAGLALIKAHEGVRLKAYRDPVGIWTIGYGHTSAAGAPEVKPGMTITPVEAEAILRRDIAKFERYVTDAIDVPLNENQFSALVSFCFNVGPSAFRKSSVRRYVNDRNFSGVPARLALWNKGGGKVWPGLVRRRKDEGDLFMTPVASEPPVQPQYVGAGMSAPPDVEPPPTDAPSKPVNPKPLKKSRTIWGAVSAAAGTAGTAVSDAGSQLAGISHYSTGLTVLFVTLTLAGIGMVTYARIDDAGLLRKGDE